MGHDPVAHMLENVNFSILWHKIYNFDLILFKFIECTGWASSCLLIKSAKLPDVLKFFILELWFSQIISNIHQYVVLPSISNLF